MGQHLGRLLGRGALLRQIFGQQRLGLLAQPPGLLEIGLDAGAALVEPLVHGAQDRAARRDDEDDEGDGDPGFGIPEELHHARSRANGVHGRGPFPAHGFHGLGHVSGGRRHPDQPRHQLARRLAGDVPQIGDRPGLGLDDTALHGLGLLGEEGGKLAFPPRGLCRHGLGRLL